MSLAIFACSGASGRTSAAADASPQATVATAASLWKASLTDTFQWQLSGTLDATVRATVYDVDAFATSRAFVASAHALGRHVVCYVDAGSFERGRPDAGAFPAKVLGAAYVGYPQERWLDIRRIDLLGPIMDARLDPCRRAGFDAVEPDNINGWQNTTGFPLSAQDQIAYNRWFADHTHKRGLSIALKNDGDQYSSLSSSYDSSKIAGTRGRAGSTPDSLLRASPSSRSSIRIERRVRRSSKAFARERVRPE